MTQSSKWNTTKSDIKRQKTVFLDRDGVICENRDDYVKSWDEFSFIPGAKESIRLLTQNGFQIIIVTNQSVINRGIISSADVEAINQKMVSELEKVGGKIADIFVCPHRPDEACSCRKPKPGLLLQAGGRFNADYRCSYLVGDAMTDILAGKIVGCRTILLTDQGRSQSKMDVALVKPDFVAKDLRAAVRWLLNDDLLSEVQSPMSKA